MTIPRISVKGNCQGKTAVVDVVLALALPSLKYNVTCPPSSAAKPFSAENPLLK
jgi:hypothetical protein